MIDSKTMNKLINSGVSTVVKKNQRPSKQGIISMIVNIDSTEYKSCQMCGNFSELMNYTGKHSTCNNCRAEGSKVSYEKDFNSKTYHIWHSMKKRTSVHCSLKEFRNFFSGERDEFTGRTLEEDFNYPHHNRLLRLEIDHVIPVSSGGNSNIENLQVVPSWYNRAKRNATIEEWKEIEEKFLKLR